MNNKQRDNKIMGIIVTIVVILIVAQTVNNLIQLNKLNKANYEEKPMIIGTVSQVSDTELSGAASFTSSVGSTRMCYNIPPIITYECNLTNAVLNTSLNYNCKFNATDPNGDNINFSSEWITPFVIFNISSNGTINFTPKRIHMGTTHTVRIHAKDNSGCSNNDRYLDINMTVNGTNRAPYLSKNIPNQKIVKDHNFIFYLSEYFTDPDEDVLMYWPITMYGSTAAITITGNQVVVKGLSCGNTTAYYVARDPGLLVAWSNYATYEVTCPDTSLESAGNQNEQEGSGGGGRGGNQELCTPHWKCSAWSPCTYGNFTFSKCIDYSACDPQNYQNYMFENCTFVTAVDCIEQWECNEWSTCKNDKHTRTCLDIKNCMTNKTKPVESENCTAIQSCFNGIKDQDETDVDCGGQCGVCRNIESPTDIETLSLITIIAGALGMGVSGILVFAFRVRIIAAYMRIFSKKPKIKRKAYINAKQKEKLLQLVNIIQARVDEHKTDHAIDELSVFIKEYFKQLLAIERLDKQEILNQIIQLKDKDLETLLVIFYAKIINITHLRNKGAEIQESEIQALIDEISHTIYLVAEFTDQDAIHAIKDRSTESQNTLDKLYNKISNLYIALQFGELILAKSLYKEILKDYEMLSHKDKAIPYTDIIRAFHAINYLDKLYKL